MTIKERADVKRFYKAVLKLKTVEECSNFFDDICTFQEVESMAQRLEVACRLIEGQSYVDINKATGASTATICRVNKCLNYGEGGYKTAIERLEKYEL